MKQILLSQSYIKNSIINIWLAATTLPIKNPTNTLLWNFLIIIVPPIHNISRTIELHMLMNASVPLREDIAHMARVNWIIVVKRMEYLE